MRKKKRKVVWLGFLQGIAGALAIYIMGLLILTGLILHGILPENTAIPCVMVWCAISAASSGVLCRCFLGSGDFRIVLASAVLFAATLLSFGMCWTGINWAGEGGGVLAATVVGLLIAGAMRRKKHRRKNATL